MHNFTGINYTLLKLLVHFPVLHYFSIKESRLKWRPSEETVTMENKKGNVNFLASGLRQDVSQCSPSSCKSTVLGTTASFLGRRLCSCTGNPAHKRAFTRGLMLWCCHIKILNRLSLILALVSGVRWDSGACARALESWSPTTLPYLQEEFSVTCFPTPPNDHCHIRPWQGPGHGRRKRQNLVHDTPMC